MYTEMASLENDHWWFKGRRAVVFDLIRRQVTPGGRILDVGLGTGYNAALLQKLGFCVDGVEPAVEVQMMISSLPQSIRVFSSEFPCAEVPDSSYDAVLLLDVLEHLPDERAALADVYRVLKPGGCVIITVPAFGFLWSDHDKRAHHVRRYRKSELFRSLQTAHLAARTLSYYNFFLFPPIVVVRFITKAVPRFAAVDDFKKTPAMLNFWLAALFSGEKYLLRWISFPWGVSLVACAFKK